MERDMNPSLETCIKTVREINKNNPLATEEVIIQNARWLYFINRLSFWEDIPVLIDLIKYEKQKSTKL